MRSLITASRLMLPPKIQQPLPSGPANLLEDAALLIEDGRIAAITNRQDAPAHDEHFDFPEATICPSYVDIHIHGGLGHDVMEGTPQALQAVGGFLATRGVGAYFPTTVTAPVDEILRALSGLARLLATKTGPAQAEPLGIHLEGPFISHEKRGVHPPPHIKKPSIALFDRFWQAAEGTIRLLTIAPEVEGENNRDEALALIEHATKLGVRASLGHSNADTEMTRRAIAAGAVSATHTFNAMRPLDHRDPGILGTVLDTDSLYAELICDGIHVDPAIVRLFWRAKGPTPAQSRAILITDGMSAAGMPDGEYMLGSFAVQVKEGRCMHDGHLAGSVLTLDQGVRNFLQFTGASLPDAVRLATLNPTRLTGVDAAHGVLAEGRAANLNVVTADGQLAAVYLHGERIR